MAAQHLTQPLPLRLLLAHHVDALREDTLAQIRAPAPVVDVLAADRTDHDVEHAARVGVHLLGFDEHARVPVDERRLRRDPPRRRELPPERLVERQRRRTRLRARRPPLGAAEKPRLSVAATSEAWTRTHAATCPSAPAATCPSASMASAARWLQSASAVGTCCGSCCDERRGQGDAAEGDEGCVREGKGELWGCTCMQQSSIQLHCQPEQQIQMDPLPWPKDARRQTRAGSYQLNVVCKAQLGGRTCGGRRARMCGGRRTVGSSVRGWRIVCPGCLMTWSAATPTR